MQAPGSIVKAVGAFEELLTRYADIGEKRRRVS